MLSFTKKCGRVKVPDNEYFNHASHSFQRSLVCTTTVVELAGSQGKRSKSVSCKAMRLLLPFRFSGCARFCRYELQSVPRPVSLTAPRRSHYRVHGDSCWRSPLFPMPCAVAKVKGDLGDLELAWEVIHPKVRVIVCFLALPLRKFTNEDMSCTFTS